MRELSILCYHGLVNKQRQGFNSSGKHLDLEEFKRQIRFLTSKFEIVTMQDVEDFYQKKKDLPKKSVAITFDDGYLNNLKYAHPILEDLNIKATIYLATGYIGNKKFMWTDKLERLVMSLPFDNLNLCIDKPMDFDISTMGKKLVALNKIKLNLKKSSPEKIDSTIMTLSHLTEGTELITDPDLHFFLDWNDVRFMNASGVWQIGAHTVDHFSLGVLNSVNGVNQIKLSISKIKEELNLRHLPLFSYPEGLKFDIPKYSIKFLNQIGLKSAPSAMTGKNFITRYYTRNSMYLKRYLVGFESKDFPWDIAHAEK